MKWLVAVGLGIWFGAVAAAEPSLGEKVYQHCVQCHGEAAQGGEDGKYPRLTGLPLEYLVKQLKAFKLRKRLNKPMLPVFKNWRFNEDIMSEVAGHIAGLPLDTASIPRFQPSAEALEQFDSVEEFAEVGEEIFDDNCDQCHGEDARGLAEKKSPPLLGQYPRYLMKQLDDFAAGRREHEHQEKLFGEMYPEEREAVIAHIDRLRDG